jgi:hypothetical protein
MSRGWERKKAKLFEHYFRLWLEQVASPLPSLPLPRCESHEKAFDGGSDDKTTFCREKIPRVFKMVVGLRRRHMYKS